MDSSVNSRASVSQWGSPSRALNSSCTFLDCIDFGSLLASGDASSASVIGQSDHTSSLQATSSSADTAYYSGADSTAGTYQTQNYSSRPESKDRTEEDRFEEDSQNKDAAELATAQASTIQNPATSDSNPLSDVAGGDEVEEIVSRDGDTASDNPDQAIQQFNPEGLEDQSLTASLQVPGSDTQASSTEIVSNSEATWSVDTLTEAQDAEPSNQLGLSSASETLPAEPSTALNQATSQETVVATLDQSHLQTSDSSANHSSTGDSPSEPLVAAKAEATQQDQTGANRRSRAGRRSERSPSIQKGSEQPSLASSNDKAHNQSSLPTNSASNESRVQTGPDSRSSDADPTDSLGHVPVSTVDIATTSGLAQASETIASGVSIGLMLDDSSTLTAPVESSSARSVSSTSGTETGQTSWQNRSEQADQSPTLPTPDQTVKNMNQTEKLRLIQRVARSFSRLGPDGGTVQLRLHPPELGALSIQVRMEGRSMAAHLTTQSEAARDVILESLPQLRTRLAEQGFEISQFTIDVGDNGTFSDSPPSHQDPGRQDQHPSGTLHHQPMDLRRSHQLRRQLDLADVTTASTARHRLGSQPGIDLHV